MMDRNEALGFSENYREIWRLHKKKSTELFFLVIVIVVDKRT